MKVRLSHHSSKISEETIQFARFPTSSNFFRGYEAQPAIVIILILTVLIKMGPN